jgi:hypothetical protein
MDDPTLALIARFVGGRPDPGTSDTEFLLRQVAEIEQYVARFPAQEREARALRWIEANAARYRERSQKQAALQNLAHARCPDCPLSPGDEPGSCSIHRRWLALLRLYAASELSSRDFVEQSLALLAANKDQLKVHRCRESRVPGSAGH